MTISTLGRRTGVATDPVATAASNNPALSTLVTAVGAAGLGHSLNSADGITVFAPVNSAFEVTGSGEDFTVNGPARVVCGDVRTANAAVYLIDGVLLPSRAA